jgi:hypothetical protein
MVAILQVTIEISRESLRTKVVVGVLPGRIEGQIEKLTRKAHNDHLIVVQPTMIRDNPDA